MNCSSMIIVNQIFFAVQYCIIICIYCVGPNMNPKHLTFPMYRECGMFLCSIFFIVKKEKATRQDPRNSYLFNKILG